MAKPIITPDLLRSLLRYEPETGLLYWKYRPPHMFSLPYKAQSWNTQYAGKRAMSCLDKNGYEHGTVARTSLSAHRAIWAIVHGYFPNKVDHINGVRSDNRLTNLREVSDKENARNTAVSSKSLSGVTGVRWLEERRHWVAQITINRKLKYLGSFHNKDEAIAARKAADERYGFHANHGRSAAL